MSLEAKGNGQRRREKEFMLNKFKGCLIGCAVGDAIGAPVEAQKGEVCQAYIENNVRPQLFLFVKRNQGNHSFGQYTDDTQLTRELALSLVEKKEFDPEDYAKRLVSLFRDTIVVGYGKATKQSVVRLSRGSSWRTSGEKPPAAGNGSAMRVAPIGLFYQDTEKLSQAAHYQGIMTHSDPRCSAGAVAIAGAVHFSSRLNEDPSFWWHKLSNLVLHFDKELARNIFLLETMVNDTLEIALKKVQKMSDSSFRETRWEGISPYVVPSVLWSLYSFLRTPHDFMETICTSIWPGGDVDTTAAMAGAISGAFNGLESIPENIAREINDHGKWGYEELCGLAEKLYQASEKNPE